MKNKKVFFPGRFVPSRTVHKVPPGHSVPSRTVHELPLGRFRSCPVMSGHFRSCPVISGHVRSCPVMSDHVRPCPGVSGHVRSCPGVSGHVRAFPVISGHFRWYYAYQDQIFRIASHVYLLVLVRCLSKPKSNSCPVTTVWAQCPQAKILCLCTTYKFLSRPKSFWYAG
jgi:hypothetical protein